MKSKKIIAIIGEIASGKGTAADFFVNKYHFKQITMSNFLREEAKRRKKHPTREYLRKLQSELRKKYGQNVLVKEAIKKIKSSRNKKIVIDGLRDYREAKYAKKKLDLKIILVKADPYIRFIRQKERAREGYCKTFTEFLHEDAMENAIFDFSKTKKLADFEVDSNGNKKILYKGLLSVAKKLKI